MRATERNQGDALYAVAVLWPKMLLTTTRARAQLGRHHARQTRWDFGRGDLFGRAVRIIRSSTGQTSGGALTPSRFQAITYAELEKLPTSGCSFSLSRGKETIAFWDTQEKPADKPQFWFKIDGKLTTRPGSSSPPASSRGCGCSARSS